MSICARSLLWIGFISLGLTVNPKAGASYPKGKSKDYIEFQRTIDWLRASEQHNLGTIDPAAEYIGSWPTSELQSISKCVRKLIKSGKKDIPSELRKNPELLNFLENPNQSLKRGALLHTEIAILQLNTGDHGRYAAKLIQVDDGRGNILTGGEHWAVARSLLDMVAPEPKLDELVKQWYIGTSAFMFTRREWGFAERNLTRAMKLFPNNARILFYVGVFHEICAAPDIQSINARPPHGIRANVESKKSELKQARSFFQKSLAINPDSPDVHLHLGRVMGLLGDHDKAAVELQKAEVGLKDSLLQYYCSLFLGHEFAVLNRRDKARSRFERAATLYPNAQSPLLSLSQLALSSGDFANASLSVQKVFGLPTGSEIPEDPWFSYDISHVRDCPALLLEIYRVYRGLRQ